MTDIIISVVMDREADALIDRDGDSIILRTGSTPGTGGNVGALDPAVLKPSLTDGNGNLRHSLVTSLYNGGIPTNAAELRPSLVTADGKLKPSLTDAAGNLNAGLLKVGVPGIIGVIDPTSLE